jgi:hypothetical protein
MRDPGRGELDGQWDTVQPPADLDNWGLRLGIQLEVSFHQARRVRGQAGGVGRGARFHALRQADGVPLRTSQLKCL